jgi:hypothetical protein
LTFKSWWTSERERKESLAMQARFAALEQASQTMAAELDSLSETTRGRIDSVRAWVLVRAREISNESEGDRLEMARRAWLDAKQKLPADLSAYERKVALKEVKTTIVTWFELSNDDWKLVTSEG